MRERKKKKNLPPFTRAAAQSLGSTRRLESARRVTTPVFTTILFDTVRERRRRRRRRRRIRIIRIIRIIRMIRIIMRRRRRRRLPFSRDPVEFCETSPSTRAASRVRPPSYPAGAASCMCSARRRAPSTTSRWGGGIGLSETSGWLRHRVE